MNEYPFELTLIPKQIIGLVYHPEHHRKFEYKMRSYLKTIKILSFKSEKELHTSKRKRDYVGYTPNGVLKRFWMSKQQEVILSTLIILIEINLSKALKKEEKKIIKTIETVKSKINSIYKPKIVVVIITKDPLPVSHFFDELIKKLKQTCQLETKLLFFIEDKNIGTPLSMQKFDKLVYDLSVTYYKEKLFKVRKLKNEVKIEIQPHLYTRHRFKVGFYHEVLSNPLKSLKYYKQAYKGCRLIKIGKSFSEKEICYISDWINFKICYLEMQYKEKDNKQLSETITWFLDHMANIRKKYGGKKFTLKFEYYKNVSNQYKMFGQLLEANKNRLNLNEPFQNPGYYYQLSANFLEFCRKSSLEYTTNYSKTAKSLYSEKDFEKNDETLVKTGYVGRDILYIDEKEKKKIKSKGNSVNIRSVSREVFYNHEEVIIDLLLKTYKYFKATQSMKIQGSNPTVLSSSAISKKNLYYLLSQCAEQYYNLNKWKESKDYFNKIRRFYFQNGWYSILTPILKKMLHCSKMLNHTEDYVEICLNLLSNKFDTDMKEKNEHLKSIKLFCDSSKKLDLPPMSKPVVIQINNSNNYHNLINLNVNFDSPFVVVYKEVNFNIRFESFSALPIKFHRLKVNFNDPTYNIVSKKKVVINPGINELSFPLQFGEKKDIEVVSVELLKGKKQNNVIMLKWTNDINVIGLLDAYDCRSEVGDGFIHRPVIRITEPPSTLSIEVINNPPMLVNENFCIVLALNSKTEHILKGNVIVSTSFKDVKVYEKTISKEVNRFSFDVIKPNETKKILLYVKATIPEEKNFKFRVEYATTLYPQMCSQKDFKIWVKYPTVVKFSVMGTRSSNSGKTLKITPNKEVEYNQKYNTKSLVERVSKNNYYFNSDEKILLNTSLMCVTSFPVYLKKCEIFMFKGMECFSKKVINVKGNFPYFKKGVKNLAPTKKDLSKNDIFSFSHVVGSSDMLSGKEGVKNVDLGVMKITCVRNMKTDNEQLLYDFTYEIPLPKITLINSPITVHLDYTTKNLEFGKPIKLEVTVTNNCEVTQEVQLTIRNTKDFLLSGITEIIFSIIPYGKRVFSYVVVPISKGKVDLPKFVVASLTNSFIVCQNELWGLFIK